MAVLGKDLLDFRRPLTHTKVQFGEKQYWIEENSKGIPYGTVLTELLNFDATAYIETVAQFHNAIEKKNDEDVICTLTALRAEFLKLPFYKSYMETLGWIDLYLAVPEFIDTIYEDIDKLSFFFYAAEDIPLIQKQYAWFIDSALDDGGQRRKKGQRKIPPAERILMNLMEAYVSGRSLGSDPTVDAPNVQMQYAVLQTEGGAEIVEKMYFDRLIDFAYVELMKGLQKGFLPKRCPNCGRWFVQEPGMDFNYCANPAPQDPAKLCRDIGATNNFLDKKKNHEIWNIHQRAYRKYYARMKKKNMTKDAFFDWAEEAAELRDELLPKYDAADPEERTTIAERYAEEINKI